MPAMSLDHQINKYLQFLEPDEKRSILGIIKALVKYKDLPEGTPPTIEQYNKELDEAEAYMDAGNSISQDEAEKLAEKWF